jgi:hypothetical protein
MVIKAVPRAESGANTLTRRNKLPEAAKLMDITSSRNRKFCSGPMMLYP